MRQRLSLLPVLAFYVPAAAAACAWIWWRGGLPLLLERSIGDRPVAGAAAGLAVGVGVALASRRLARSWEAGRRMEDALLRVLGPLSTRTCLVLALASGIAEELVFRGALQPEVGLVAASLLFGLVHFPLERDLLAWPFLAAGVGVILGLLFAWSGGVLAPALAHVGVNFLNLRYLSREAERRARSVDERSRGAPSDEEPPTDDGVGPEDT